GPVARLRAVQRRVHHVAGGNTPTLRTAREHPRPDGACQPVGGVGGGAARGWGIDLRARLRPGVRGPARGGGGRGVATARFGDRERARLPPPRLGARARPRPGRGPPRPGGRLRRLRSGGGARPRAPLPAGEDRVEGSPRLRSSGYDRRGGGGTLPGAPGSATRG